jgi:hypothetical protein
MKTPMQQAIEAVIYAWTIEGQHPPTHNAAKEKLRREWPTLANALDALAREKP